MSKGFAGATKEYAARTINEGDQAGAEAAQAPQSGATSSALSTGDSLRQKEAAGAAKLANVQKAAKKLQVEEAVLQGRKDAKDVALAYAVGALDEEAKARSEVVLQLQAGRQKINASTDDELIDFIEEMEDNESESLGNLIAYSGRNGANSLESNLLAGIF